MSLVNFRFLVLILSFLPSLLVAGQQCISLFKKHNTLPQVEVAERESAVEIEFKINEKNVEFITTTDGTLKPLFASDSDLPLKVSNFIYSQSWKKSIKQFLFDQLPSELRVEIVKKAIIARNYIFENSVNNQRSIKGLKVKEKYQSLYSILPTVEYGSMEGLKTGEDLEIHIRKKDLPGRLVKLAGQVQKAMGQAPGSVHLHIVFDTPFDWLKENPDIRTWQFFEYWRRLNLAFEMVDVIENGSSLLTNIDREGTVLNSTFNNLGSPYVYYAISNLAKKNLNHSIGSYSKYAWIGFWDQHKYDQPNLIGFEVRYLNASKITNAEEIFFNSLPRKIKNKDFGLSEDYLKNWSESLGVGYSLQFGFSETLSSKLIPHRTFYDLYLSLPSESKIKIFLNHQFNIDRYQKLVSRSIRSTRDKSLRLSEAEEQEMRSIIEVPTKLFESKGRLRYLIHDWSDDVLIRENKEFAERIKNAQLSALRQINRNPTLEKEIIQNFLLDSGLYELFTESVGY